MSQSSQVDPKLPFELERIIFSFAVNEDPMSFRILQVSRRVREWIEPLLYRALFITQDESRINLLFESHPQNIQAHCKSLLIEADLPQRTIVGLLELLSSIENLAYRHNGNDKAWEFVTRLPTLTRLRTFRLAFPPAIPPYFVLKFPSSIEIVELPFSSVPQFSSPSTTLPSLKLVVWDRIAPFGYISAIQNTSPHLATVIRYAPLERNLIAEHLRKHGVFHSKLALMDVSDDGYWADAFVQYIEGRPSVWDASRDDFTAGPHTW